MSNQSTNINHGELKNNEQAAREIEQQLALARSTVVIGAGGSGARMITHLKANLESRLGDRWRDKIALLAFDTADEPAAVYRDGETIILEPNSEYINIGEVPVGRIAANIERLPAIQQRLGPILHNLPNGAMRGNGAKQTRPLGLLSYQWHFPIIFEKLQQVIWRLAGRTVQGALDTQQTQGINIFICNSLAGGTGSGIFIDLAYLIRFLCQDLGDQDSYAQLTLVSFLPQAFPHISGPNILPNTGAALTELDHLAGSNAFQVLLPDGRSIDLRETPFDLVYLIDGVDERGRTWPGTDGLAAMAAEGIFHQMATQIGQQGTNAFDNLDHVLQELTPEGEHTLFSSFGIASMVFPAGQLSRLYAQWLLLDQIDVWLEDGSAPQIEPYTSNGLAPDQLFERLSEDPETGRELRISFVQPEWLAEQAGGDIANQALRTIEAYRENRLQSQLLPAVYANVQRETAQSISTWHKWAAAQLFGDGVALAAVIDRLTAEQAGLKRWRDMKSAEIEALEGRLAQQENALKEAHKVLAEAATSFVIGRSGRIRQALTQLFQLARIELETRLSLAVHKGCQTCWEAVREALHTTLHQLERVVDRLHAVKNHVSRTAEATFDGLQRNKVAEISLDLW